MQRPLRRLGLGFVLDSDNTTRRKKLSRLIVQDELTKPCQNK